MTKHVFTLLWVLFCFAARAQDFNNYSLLRSQGQMPEKFLISSSEKYESEAKENIDRSEKKRVRKAKDKFYLESNFLIDDLLLSGKVIYNDPAGQYVNKVLDELLKDDKELRSKLEVYVVRSSVVNAFTTNQGIIFINLGLLSQLENEAQLAYILCHEIVHYTKKHTINAYVERSDIVKGRGEYRGASFDERMMAQSKYSKSKEKEADLEGLEMYLKSGYSLAELGGVFDVLRYSHVPFDITPFERSFLETEYLKIPDEFFLKELSAIEPDDEEDSLGTHPGALDRKEKVTFRVEGLSDEGRKKFIVGEKEFNTVQKISRYEICNIFLVSRRYEDAFYHTYLLLKEDSNSLYLKKCMARALYGLSKYKNADEFEEVHTPYKKVQGSAQQVSYLFVKLNDKELNGIALRYLWQLKKDYPDDKEIAAWTEDILHNFISDHEEDVSYFSRHAMPDSTAQPVAIEEIRPDGTTVDVKESKYDKLNKKNAKEEKKNDFIKYGFVDVVADPEFLKFFDETAKVVKQENEEEEKRLAKKYKRQLAREERLNKRKGYALGIDKIVFVNPFYYKVDERKKDALRYLASENAQKEFNDLLKQNASQVGLEYAMLDHNDLGASQTEAFNDLMFLTDYFSETTDHDQDMGFIHNNSTDIQELREKYGTKYFCWTGIIAVKEKKNVPIGAIVYGVIIYPILPFVIYGALKPENEFYLASMVVDLESGKRVYSKFQDFDYRDRGDLLDASIYDMCNQFKTKRKKK